MATKTVVCPECDAPLAPGRFACSACGALVASVASGARPTVESAATASPAESGVAWSTAAPPVAPAATPPEAEPGHHVAEPAAQLDLDAAGWDLEPELPTVAPTPPVLAVPAVGPQEDASLPAAQMPTPPTHRRARATSSTSTASSPPPPVPPAPPIAAPEPQPSWPTHPSWPLPAELPPAERPAMSASPAAEGTLAEPDAAAPAPDGFRFSDLHPTAEPDDPAEANEPRRSTETDVDDVVVPAGAYLPPSAVLPPAEALPLPGAAVATPSRSGWQLPTISGGLGRIEVPVEASTRTIAAGGFVALAGFLLPWADVVIGSRSIGSFLDQWGLAAPGAPIVLLLVAAVTATAVMRDSLPPWVGLSSAAVAVAFLLIGLVWPYLFGPFGASIGIYAVTVGALVLVVGGLIDRVASRHAAAETGV